MKVDFSNSREMKINFIFEKWLFIIYANDNRLTTKNNRSFSARNEYYIDHFGIILWKNKCKSRTFLFLSLDFFKKRWQSTLYFFTFSPLFPSFLCNQKKCIRIMFSVTNYFFFLRVHTIILLVKIYYYKIISESLLNKKWDRNFFNF